MPINRSLDLEEVPQGVVAYARFPTDARYAVIAMLNESEVLSTSKTLRAEGKVGFTHRPATTRSWLCLSSKEAQRTRLELASYANPQVDRFVATGPARHKFATHLG